MKTKSLLYSILAGALLFAVCGTLSAQNTNACGHAQVATDDCEWVNSQLVYPEIAKENGVQGRVTLQFTVEADGRVTNVKVLRGVDESLDKEAVRVVSSSPKWKPGKQRDRAVKVTYTFPVIFQLR